MIKGLFSLFILSFQAYAAPMAPKQFNHLSHALLIVLHELGLVQLEFGECTALAIKDEPHHQFCNLRFRPCCEQQFNFLFVDLQTVFGWVKRRDQISQLCTNSGVGPSAFTIGCGSHHVVSLDPSSAWKTGCC
jgi:hypothetical protein